jgi:hypothetical protein
MLVEAVAPHRVVGISGARVTSEEVGGHGA